jgi:hypothetical protein
MQVNANLNIKATLLTVLACGVDEISSIQNAKKKQQPETNTGSWFQTYKPSLFKARMMLRSKEILILTF